jgi:hypothetical protein
LFGKQIKISRTDLYERVWTTPLRTLAKEFGLSDVGLAKLCRRHDIPLPGRGYWVRMQFGKKQERTALPDAKMQPPRQSSSLPRSLDHTRKTSRQGGCARIKQSLEYECVARAAFAVQIFKQDGRTSSLLAACGRRDLAELSACVLHGMCRAPHW